MQSKNSAQLMICHRGNNDLNIVIGARWDCTFCLHLITCDCLGMGMYHIRLSFSFNYCTDFNKECAQKYKTLVYYSCHLLLCFQKLDFSQSFRHEMHSVQTSNARTLLKATIDWFIIYNFFYYLPCQTLLPPHDVLATKLSGLVHSQNTIPEVSQLR